MKVTEQMVTAFQRKSGYRELDEDATRKGLQAVLDQIEPDGKLLDAELRVMNAAKAYYRTSGEVDQHNELMASLDHLWAVEGGME